MHMADALLSPAVGLTMNAVSTAAVAYSIAKIKKEEVNENKIPMMGVVGAFVFAAQMINFTIPGTGSSGHIGGGVLLAAMLGGVPALLVIAAVLIIQCLFFADGGLLALGCNIFNMGVIPCLLAYPLLFKPFLRKGVSFGRITLASLVCAVIGLQIGAFCVVLQTQLSGVTALPFGTFVLLMQPIHLAIGVGEGLITAAVLCFVYQARPEILEAAGSGTALRKDISLKKIFIVFAAAAAVTAGLLSLFASQFPDGLEWSIERTAGTPELDAEGQIFENAASVQGVTAIMPDYELPAAGSAGATTAGIAGAVLTFVLAGASAGLIGLWKKRKKSKAAI